MLQAQRPELFEQSPARPTSTTCASPSGAYRLSYLDLDGQPAHCNR